MCERVAGCLAFPVAFHCFSSVLVCVCGWPSGGIYILIKNFYNYINSSRREDMPFVYLIFWVEAVKCIELPVCRLFFC